MQACALPQIAHVYIWIILYSLHYYVKRMIPSKSLDFYHNLHKFFRFLFGGQASLFDV